MGGGGGGGGGGPIGDYDFAMRHFRSTHRDYWKKSFVNRDRTELRLCENVNFFFRLVDTYGKVLVRFCSCLKKLLLFLSLTL